MTEFTDREALAAEYALGTLDTTERQQADVYRREDSVFAGLIRDWDARLAPLIEGSRDVAPPSNILQMVLARISGPAQSAAQGPVSNVIVLQRKLRVWRGVALSAGALAAALGLWIAGGSWLQTSSSRQTYLAVLQAGSDTPSFIVSVDLDRRQMTVIPASAKEPVGKSYELWIIAPDHGIPKSLGVIDASNQAHPALPDIDRSLISQATYAVTLEDQGGSPTGKPTSKPTFIGHLIDAPLTR